MSNYFDNMLINEMIDKFSYELIEEVCNKYPNCRNKIVKTDNIKTCTICGWTKKLKYTLR